MAKVAKLEVEKEENQAKEGAENKVVGSQRKNTRQAELEP